MTTTTASPPAPGTFDLYVEQRGSGPDVLLIGGLGDPLEAWEAQLQGLSDRYRLTAFDNRGAGRSPLPDGPFTVERMADDAAEVLRELGIPSAHVAGFSGGSIIAQELALRHPDRVRSLVLVSTWARKGARWHAVVNAVRWMAQCAPSERAFLEAFFLWIYTRRAHEDGTVQQIVEESLAFPHPATPEAIGLTLDAFAAYENADRLPQVTVPSLVIAGGQDPMTPPAYGRAVADLLPDARFEVWDDEAHQPFQEVPDAFNERVDSFWREVGGRP